MNSLILCPMCLSQHKHLPKMKMIVLFTDIHFPHKNSPQLKGNNFIWCSTKETLLALEGKSQLGFTELLLIPPFSPYSKSKPPLISLTLPPKYELNLPLLPTSTSTPSSSSQHLALLQNFLTVSSLPSFHPTPILPITVRKSLKGDSAQDLPLLGPLPAHLENKQSPHDLIPHLTAWPHLGPLSLRPPCSGSFFSIRALSQLFSLPGCSFL